MQGKQDWRNLTLVRTGVISGGFVLSFVRVGGSRESVLRGGRLTVWMRRRYKGFGTGVIDKAGTRDRNEFYNVRALLASYPPVESQSNRTQSQVSKDDLLSLIPPLPAPAVLTTNRPLLESYALAAHTITTLLLTHLCTHLHLPPTSPCYLPSLHRLTAPSADVIRFVKAPPQPVADRRVALGEHTDFGSLTLLFNHLGGLQILPPGRDAQWVYVRPLPGHAIVNLGDAMVKFTNGLLRSNIHRVVSPPGEQAEATRYSLVYFARAEDEVLLRRLDDGDVIPELAEGAEPEEVISSREWVLRRALGKRVVKGEEGLREGEWDKSLGTEGLSRRSYL